MPVRDTWLGDRHPATATRPPLPGDRYPATGLRPAPGDRPGTRRPAPGDRHPATGTQRPAPGDRYPATGLRPAQLTFWVPFADLVAFEGSSWLNLQPKYRGRARNRPDPSLSGGSSLPDPRDATGPEAPDDPGPGRPARTPRAPDATGPWTPQAPDDLRPSQSGTRLENPLRPQ